MTNPTQKKLKAAVVGVGYLGTFHAQKYANNPNVNLVGVFDQSQSQAQKVAAELKVKAFSDIKELVGNIDLATIACSTQAHYEVAKFLISNGVHVNIEKPITAKVEQAIELLDLAKKKNIKVAVGHIERFNPCIQELKKMIKAPKVIELTRHATYKARGADVSVLHDLMIHDLDLLLWLSGSDILKVTASGNKVISKELDSATASFEMKNGTLGVISVSRVASAMTRSIRVIDQDKIYLANTGALEIEISSKNADAKTEVKFEKIQVEKKDALQSETDAFIDSVKNNTPLKVSGVDGKIALSEIEKIETIIEGR